MGIRETHPLVCQLVDVRRRDAALWIKRTNIPISQVIAEDDDDVGFGGMGSCREGWARNDPVQANDDEQPPPMKNGSTHRRKKPGIAEPVKREESPPSFGVRFEVGELQAEFGEYHAALARAFSP
jgi:hypothetical protein